MSPNICCTNRRTPLSVFRQSSVARQAAASDDMDPREKEMPKNRARPTKYTGACFVVKDNIDTDQIIPAEYLTLVPSKVRCRVVVVSLPFAFGHLQLATRTAYVSSFLIRMCVRDLVSWISRRFARAGELLYMCPQILYSLSKHSDTTAHQASMPLG